MEVTRHNRVSPWEIDPSGSVSGPSSMVPPGTKRTRISIPTTKSDFPLPAGYCSPKKCFRLTAYLELNYAALKLSSVGIKV